MIPVCRGTGLFFLNRSQDSFQLTDVESRGESLTMPVFLAPALVEKNALGGNAIASQLPSSLHKHGQACRSDDAGHRLSRPGCPQREVRGMRDNHNIEVPLHSKDAQLMDTASRFATRAPDAVG